MSGQFSPRLACVIERFQDMFESAGIDGESLTVVLVSGGSKSEVLAVLGADPDPTELEGAFEDEAYSAYAVADVTGGVVAFEHTGYADPSPRVLAAPSALGGASAVTRSNIQGHERFGCARAGQLEFDADEFVDIREDEKSAVPPELRPLFDTAWIDLDDDDDEEVGSDEWVGFAMAALHTDVQVTTADLVGARERGYHRVRALTYLE
jgi:hypothetical protein